MLERRAIIVLTMWLVVEQLSVPGVWVLAYPLPEREVVIGRSDECDIVINGSKVSRKHLTLRRKGKKVAFHDLDSTDGVFYDGHRIEKGTLTSGDTIVVQETVLRIEKALPEAQKAYGTSATVDDDGMSWQPFQAFLETLRKAGEPRVLLERLLLGLVKIFDAERGFVLLRDKANPKLIPVATHRVDDTEDLVSISSTIYQRAIETGDIVLVQNSREDQSCAGAMSLATFEQPRSIICGPLRAEGQVFGVIYIDTPMLREPIAPSRVRLFETVTGLSSQLLAAGRTRKNLLAARGRLKVLNRLVWEGEDLIFGKSSYGKTLRDTLEAASAQDVSVLLTGETGTGKEMVARTLHRMSSRRDGPFVAVNCAALPREMIEGELFGAEKGSYTGATERRIGRFEVASGGTLFLDEIGELPLDFQVKLLRVLQERWLTRLGGNEPIQLDFRLLCATNSDLEEAIRDGAFRQDFYYRVNVFRIELKPLRERCEDVLPLADHFLSDFAKKFNKPVTSISPEARKVLQNYPWPGNIRELRNAIERAVVIEQGSEVTLEGLPIGPGGISMPGFSSVGNESIETTLWNCLPNDYEDAREAFERTFLKRSLEQHHGNIKAVAEATGVPRSTIYRRLTKLGLIEKE